MLVSGGAACAGFGATGSGVGIAGETGAAEGENAGVVTGSSPLDAELLAERECFELGVAVDACRGTVAGAAAGAVDGAGVAAAPVWSGCGVGTGDGTESVAAAAGAGSACAAGSELMGSAGPLLPACTRFQAPSPTAMMASIVAIIPVRAARLRERSWRPVMVTGSSR